MRDEVWLQDKIEEHRRMHPESTRAVKNLLNGMTLGQSYYDAMRRETTRDLADELGHARMKHRRHKFEKMLREPREESKVPSTSSTEVMHRLRHHWDHLHGLQLERVEAYEKIDRDFERCSQATRRQIEVYERELPELCRSEATVGRARFIEALGRQTTTVFVTNPFRVGAAAATATPPPTNSTRPPKATKRRKEVIHIRKRSTQSFICLSSSSSEEEEEEEEEDTECDKQDCVTHVGKKRKQELPTVTTTDVVEPLPLLLPPPLIYNLLTEGMGAFTTELFLMLGPMELFNVYKTSQEMRRLLHTCLCEWLRAMLPEFGPMKRHNKLYFTDVNVMALYLGYTETGGTRDPHHFVPQLLRTVHALRSYLTDVGDLLAHSEVDTIQLSGERTPFLFVVSPQNNTLIPIAPLSRFNVYTSRCYDRVQESVVGRYQNAMAHRASDCWEDDDWLLLFDQHDWESLSLRPLRYTAPVAAYTHDERLTFFVVDPLDQSITLVHPVTQWKRLNTTTGRRHFVRADFTRVSSTSAIANVLDYYAVRQAVYVAVYGGDGSYQSNYVAACDAYAFSQQKLQELVSPPPPPLLSVAVGGSDDGGD